MVVRNCWREVRLEATEQVFGRTNSYSIEQTKVFNAHAVPRGLCAILINALKLLANQQEDGDGLLQNIEGPGQGEQKRSHGRPEFIKVDK